MDHEPGLLSIPASSKELNIGMGFAYSTNSTTSSSVSRAYLVLTLTKKIAVVQLLQKKTGCRSRMLKREFLFLTTSPSDTSKPLDVPTIKTNVTTQEIVDIVREGKKQ
jgi:hypothetical protein